MSSARSSTTAPPDRDELALYLSLDVTSFRADLARSPFRPQSAKKTWTSLPQTLKAKTGVSGLTSGTTYYFRSQALTPKGGEGDWGQIVALLVKESERRRTAPLRARDAPRGVRTGRLRARCDARRTGRHARGSAAAWSTPGGASPSLPVDARRTRRASSGMGRASHPMGGASLGVSIAPSRVRIVARGAAKRARGTPGAPRRARTGALDLHGASVGNCCGVTPHASGVPTKTSGCSP